MKQHYINTDFELWSDNDISSLVRFLKENDALICGPKESQLADGRWLITGEAAGHHVLAFSDSSMPSGIHIRNPMPPAAHVERP